MKMKINLYLIMFSLIMSPSSHAMTEAIKVGDVAQVQRLLEQKCDPNQPDKTWEKPPLHMAAFYGRTPIVELLLRFKSNVDVQDQNKYTALHWAAVKGHYEIVRILLQSKAKVNYKNKIKQTPLHLVSRYGSTDVAKLLLKNGAKVEIKTKSKYGKENPLHVAAEYGNPTIAKLLLQNGAKVDSKTGNGETPLHRVAGHYEIKKGHIKVVKSLLKNGATVDARNKWQGTPLISATLWGQTNIAQLLLDNNADINARGERGWPALYWALFSAGVPSYCEAKVIQFLLQKRADVDARDKCKSTLLHHVAERGDLVIAQLLLKYGASVDTQNSSGETPLYKATEKGHADIVKFLLLNNANPYVRTNRGNTPLQSAESKHRPEDVHAMKNIPCILVFLRASHPRLGANSPAHSLCRDLYKQISEMVLRSAS